MKKIKLLDDGKKELTVISYCTFIILFITSILISINVSDKKHAIFLIIFLTLNSIILSTYVYRILYYTILKNIINKYFSISNKILKMKNKFDYNTELEKMEEYIEFYKEIFTPNDIKIINFTKELVIANINYKTSLK